jgi:hypothetical protein
MLLFIDFRKAFDLVDSDLLINKLFHYGFDNHAINLIKNYFNNRQQIVKIKSTLSSKQVTKLGVPQGSLLGPLFFIIFINDLALMVKSMSCKLFADDTTLLSQGNDLNELINKFKHNIVQIITWCNMSRLDINWSKTYFMFVTNKRIKPPAEIEISGHKIKVVTEFKLLGVTIDNKLNFNKYISSIKIIVFKKMYSIKRLFHLCTAVRLQFYKTFIMPYFDYCSTIACYFPKYTLQKLQNCFNLTLERLFKFKPDNNDMNQYNNKLEKYGLNNFIHRIISRLSDFIHKIINKENSPELLKSQLILNSNIEKGHQLRNKNQFSISLQLKNHFGEATFNCFFTKFINNIILKDLYINFNFFKKRIYNNINIIYDKFINVFPKFKLDCKLIT